MATTHLEQMIEPLVELLTSETAAKFVSLRANPALQQRVDELAQRANLGQLTRAEQQEYDQYLAGFHFITLMQCRARQLPKT